MGYRVVVTGNAETDLDEFVRYLLFVKENEQAARNLLNDFEGYRRINFMFHRYFMLYRVVENTVYIDSIFHELQDYENKIW